MHIPDGYLGPPTYLAAYAACAPLWAVAARRLRERLSARRAPLLAISAAFSFLVMMFNVPLPGGTTGHAVGGVLIAIAIGPLGALFSITIALVIQALLFGDGGITAIGANCINMAFILPFTGYAVAGAPRRRAPLGCQTADDPSTQSNEALANNPPRRGTVMCMRSREVRGCRSQSDPGAPRGRQAPGMLRGSLGETGSIGWGLGLPAFGLVLALCLPLASGAQERVSRAQDQAVPEAEFDLADVLITRTPLPGSSVELRYRYERDREQQDAGSAVTHVHQPSAILSLAATDWLGLSATIPYQVRDLRTPDGTSSETRNLGDLSTEVLATFLKDPVQQLAVAGGFDLGVPTGSIKDGTGGQWTLTPFLGAGKLVGPSSSWPMGATRTISERPRTRAKSSASCYTTWQWALSSSTASSSRSWSWMARTPSPGLPRSGIGASSTSARESGSVLADGSPHWWSPEAPRTERNPSHPRKSRGGSGSASRSAPSFLSRRPASSSGD